MNFVGLISGGKDSIYSICKLIDEGNTLVALLHIVSEEFYSDSFMYQTVGSEIAQLQGKCLDVPIYLYYSKCKTLCTDLGYDKCEGDEVEDLYNGIELVMKSHKFEAISSGAILSTYQKNRVENVCQRLGLKSFAPLWNRNQKELLVEMIDYGMNARVIKIASSTLYKDCLNLNLAQLNEYLSRNTSKYEINYCGEGGEYETAVFDCPHFKKMIKAESFDVLPHPAEKEFNGCVFYLVMKDLSLVLK